MSGILQGLLAGYSFKVGSVTISNGGQYASVPSGVTFSGGGGSGATASFTMTLGVQTGSVTSVSGNQPGGYYTMTSAAPTVSFSNGNGSGATATANFGSGEVVGVSGNARTTTQSGSFTFSGGGGSGATGTYSGGAARITYTGLTVTNGGSGYTSAPTVSFSGGPAVVNNYPTATANISGGAVTSITFSVAGDQVVDQNFDLGYQLPVITISGGGGSGATATWGAGTTITVIDYWAIGGSGGSPQITNPGSGYTSAPSVSVPNIVTGSLTATIGRKVASITVNSGGSGYYSGLTTFLATLSGGTAVAGTTISHNWNTAGDWYDYYYFTGFTITNGGSGYTSAPSVSVTGGSPIIGASLTANMVLG